MSIFQASNEWGEYISTVLGELINHQRSMKGESWQRGKQRQWRALDNGCLVCLVIEIKAGNFSSEIQTGVFPLHRGHADVPKGQQRDSEREKNQTGPSSVFTETSHFCDFAIISSLQALCL